ncbi:hypothetical protein HPB51_009009 [Rhipicephalus microplus]|uniref:Peptidase M13 C-terminal domain-containing protein n=1 Tax=Rhipicephalus microplus TaxID=6941 RepID=A0A9J6D4N8_RHIMP|nr:hypothetical protein HPB51_009009 [Rhipicephalus microplus]
MSHRELKAGGSPKGAVTGSTGSRKPTEEPSKKSKHATKTNSAPQGPSEGFWRRPFGVSTACKFPGASAEKTPTPGRISSRPVCTPPKEHCLTLTVPEGVVSVDEIIECFKRRPDVEKATAVPHSRRSEGVRPTRSIVEVEATKQNACPNVEASKGKFLTTLNFRRKKSMVDTEAKRKALSDMRSRKSITEYESRPGRLFNLGLGGASLRRTAPSTHEEASARRRDQLVLAVAVFLSVLLACALAVLLFLGQIKKVGYCITDACIEHAKRLSATINTSHDPCVDFYAFVCDGWQKVFPDISIQGKLNQDATTDTIKELEADIWKFGRPSRLFGKCLEPQQSDIYHNIFWLNTFMQAVNLDWPSRQPDASKTRPLEVMINMAANYDLNFLFRLEIATNASTGNVLIFRRRYNGVIWSDRVQNPMTLVDYARLASEQLKELQLVEYVDYEPSLLQKLEKSFTYVNSQEFQGEQTWFVLGDLDPRTESIEPGLWLKGLNNAYSNQGLSWVTDNFVVLDDPEILKRIDALFREYSEAELLIGIAWMFIQSHIWVAIGKPGLMFLDNIDKKKQLACLEFVNARFALLASSNHITHLYRTPDIRLEFVKFTEYLRAEFNNIMKKTVWVDREIRETAARKIDRILLNALPPEHFFLQRETLYGLFPGINQAAFMEVWLNSSSVYQRLQLSERFHDVYKKQRTFRHQAYAYTYLLNAVDAALVALEPPLYYPGGTFAMNYASAGTLIMREMVKSIDLGGTTIDDRGESIHWWGKSESAEYNSRLSCDLGTEPGQAPMSVLPAIPALEVSYSAFKAAAEHEVSTAGGVEDLRLQGLEAFVDKQIFFMSYCYVLCGKKDDADQRRECNVPLRHSSFFADVFKCRKGSPMNVPHKCSFFF